MRTLFGAICQMRFGKANCFLLSHVLSGEILKIVKKLNSNKLQNALRSPDLRHDVSMKNPQTDFNMAKQNPIFAALFALIFGLFLPISAFSQVEIAKNGVDDDGDGLIDCFDPDVECTGACADFFYQTCLIPCAYNPPCDSISLGAQWEGSDDVGDYPVLVAGDMDGDGVPEVIVCASNRSLLEVLDGATGAQIWKHATGEKIIGSANWFVAKGITNLLVGSYDFALHCVEAATGRSNWVYETGNYINGTPAITEGRTVFGGCDAVLHIVSVADGKKLGFSVAKDGRYIFGLKEGRIENFFDISTFEVTFTNGTSAKVTFFLNGGKGLETTLNPKESKTYTMQADQGVQPQVQIYQSDGKKLGFSVAKDGRYIFGVKEGRIENFFNK